MAIDYSRGIFIAARVQPTFKRAFIRGTPKGQMWYVGNATHRALCLAEKGRCDAVRYVRTRSRGRSQRRCCSDIQGCPFFYLYYVGRAMAFFSSDTFASRATKTLSLFAAASWLMRTMSLCRAIRSCSRSTVCY